jgi:hypothetical protein
MALHLYDEEPEAGPWRVELLTTIVNAVTRRGPGLAGGRPAVLAVDGRSNNGKTTLAGRIHELVPGSVVVHTDDISWEYSCFGWADLMIDGILRPARQGQPVSYRPPPWDTHGRAGSIDVPAGCPLLIVEGDGAGRREVKDLVDTVIWVQADVTEAARRAAVRDLAMDPIDLANMPPDGSPPDHDGWTAEELPFNSDQRTWERADLFVCGSPEVPYNPATQVLVAPPLSAADSS